MTYLYLATPYSKYKEGLDAAYKMACEQRALFVKARIPCFSPIVHCHDVAKYGGIDPLDHKIWIPDDAVFMSLAKGLVVVKAEGWRDSYGIDQEIEMFSGMGKPIHLMAPGIIPTTLLEREKA